MSNFIDLTTGSTGASIYDYNDPNVDYNDEEVDYNGMVVLDVIDLSNSSSNFTDLTGD